MPSKATASPSPTNLWLIYMRSKENIAQSDWGYDGKETTNPTSSLGKKGLFMHLLNNHCIALGMAQHYLFHYLYNIIINKEIK